jgi:hypothetical protein
LQPKASTPTPRPVENLSGLTERETFINEENEFAVLRVIVQVSPHF